MHLETPQVGKRADDCRAPRNCCSTILRVRSRVVEAAGVFLAGFLLSVTMTWPLLPNATRAIPLDLIDPLLQVWLVAWGGHALLHQPLAYFDANSYWPHAESLALSGDALIGYSPVAVLGEGTTAALVRYNLLFLFAYALAFAGSYALAREFGIKRGGAVVAGAAFAYAPWRLAHSGQLHVLSSGGIPLALFLLLHGYWRAKPLVVVGGWLVATWQLSLGFNLGLELAYLLAALGVIAAVAWARAGRPPIARSAVGATAVGAGLFLLAGGVLAQPYRDVAERFPEARRTPLEVSEQSPKLESFLAAPAHNLVWGAATARFRANLRYPTEQTLFPGAAIVALALAGLAARVLTRRVRIGLVVSFLVFGVLSFGFHVALGRVSWLFPYRLLYEIAPGWSAIRTPGRINTLTSLALALLAGAGAQFLADRFRRRALIALALGVVVLEGYGRIPQPTVPPFPHGQETLGAPQLHLPSGNQRDAAYLYWSVEHFPEIANGRGAFDLRPFRDLVRSVEDFPDKRSIAHLRSLGIRVVVLHTAFAPGTAWEDAADRSIAGLPLSKRRVGGLVIYEIQRR